MSIQSGAQWRLHFRVLSCPSPKSFTFTFLESSFRTVRLLASGVVRARISSLSPRFQGSPVTVAADSDIACGRSAWGQLLLVQVYNSLLKRSRRKPGFGDLGVCLSPLPSITTSPASCHRRFRLLSFFLSSSIDGRKDKSSTDLNHCRNGTSSAAH